MSILALVSHFFLITVALKNFVRNCDFLTFFPLKILSTVLSLFAFQYYFKEFGRVLPSWRSFSPSAKQCFKCMCVKLTKLYLNWLILKIGVIILTTSYL